MARGITGKLTRVHRDAAPCKPLHIGHGGIIVLLGAMGFLFLQNGENTARGAAILAATQA